MSAAVRPAVLRTRADRAGRGSRTWVGSLWEPDQTAGPGPARAQQSKSMQMADNAQSIPLATTPANVATVRRELATLITQALNLDVAPADIVPDAPLYREGLGLDSIDVLEIALVISKQYGIHLEADSKENQVIFSSLTALSEFVAAQRTK